MNWLYYKSGRNMLVPVVFHISAGYFNEIFATHSDSKVIQTALLPTFLSIPVHNGQLALGRWQGIYLFEHRNAPYSREVVAQLT